MFQLEKNPFIFFFYTWATMEIWHIGDFSPVPRLKQVEIFSCFRRSYVKICHNKNTFGGGASVFCVDPIRWLDIKYFVDWL